MSAPPEPVPRALRADLRRGRGAVRLRRPRRDVGQRRRRCWSGPAASRSGSRASRCAAGRCSSAILDRDERFAGLMTYTLPETLWLAEQGFEDLLLAYPTADTGALERAGAALGRQPGRGADRDGRLRRAPRRDRVGARRRRGAGPGLHRRRRRLVGARRAGQGRAEALAGPHASSRRSRWRGRSSGGRRSSSSR